MTFITGNQGKADNFARLIGMDIAHQSIELDELQSDNLEKIVEHKVRQAYDIIKSPVIVDDVAMGFNALGGLPGPFVRYFVERPDGLEKMCRMLDGFDDRSAFGVSTQGYFDGRQLKIFSGRIEGLIADHPRGELGYGWDKIFCPEGYDGRTRGELTEAEYDEVYQTIRPFAELRGFFTTL